jgi:hypothetical protein
MHDVVVTGCGLDAQLADVAAQVVTVLQQPARSEQFAPVPGPRIATVEVRRTMASIDPIRRLDQGGQSRAREDRRRHQ